LALAHKFSQLLIGGLALIQTVLVLSEQVFKCASSFLVEDLVDSALREAVVISLPVNMNNGLTSVGK
jgi:hypothetical protein